MRGNHLPASMASCRSGQTTRDQAAFGLPAGQARLNRLVLIMSGVLVSVAGQVGAAETALRAGLSVVVRHPTSHSHKRTSVRTSTYSQWATSGR